MKLRHVERAGVGRETAQPPAKAAAIGAFAAFAVMVGSAAAAEKAPKADCDCRSATRKATPAQVMKADSAAAAFRDSSGAVAVPVMKSTKNDMAWDTIYARVATLPDGGRAVISGSRKYKTADTFALADVERTYARLAGKRPADFRLIPEAYTYWLSQPAVKIRAVPIGKGGISLGIQPLPYGIIKHEFVIHGDSGVRPHWEHYGSTGCICRAGPAPKVADLASLPVIPFAEVRAMEERVFNETGSRDTAGVESLLDRFRGHHISAPYPSQPLEYGTYNYSHIRIFHLAGGERTIHAHASVCDDSTCTDNAESDMPRKYMLFVYGSGRDSRTYIDLAPLDSLFRRATGKELGNASIIVDTAAGGGASTVLLPNGSDNRAMKGAPIMRVTASAKGVKTEYLMVGD